MTTGIRRLHFWLDLMDAQFWAIALAVLGFCLIVAEFFVPSGGMIALSCAGSFVASVGCAHSAWYPNSPTIFWSFILGLGVLIPSFLVLFLRTLESTSLGNNLLLPRTDSETVTPYQGEAAILDRLIGRVGTTLTQMNPGGMVRVENERLHATTEGLLLMLGETIEVIGIRGNSVIVKRATLGTQTAGLPSPAESSTGPFDVKQDASTESERRVPLAVALGRQCLLA